jgi:hypothetical protein
MSQIQSLLESANPYKSLQSDAAKLAGKWAKTGLLEGLNETDKNNMSLMLENQAKQLVTEVSQTGTGAFFTPGQGEQWAGIALPLVRKVFGQIAAKEFVSVQPMNLPSGLVFFLDFQYGTNKNPFAKNSSVYGDRGSDTSKYPFSTPAAAGGLYGTGRFTYSTNQFSASYTVASASAVTSASWADLGYDSAYSASVAAGEVKKITLSALNAVSASMDYDAVRGFLLLSGSVSNTGATNITVADNIQAFTTVNAANTILTFFVTASTAEIAPSSTMVLYYNKLTADNTRGDFEADATYAIPNSENATQIEIPEINISMVSSEITAKTKKLKAVWTPEFAQDLNAYQNIDAEAELTNMLSEYISMEIDLEILDMLIEDAAAGTEYWSAINNTVATATSAPSTLSSGFYNTQGQWFQTLGTKVQKLSNKIHQLTLRGGANFMVISPTVATIIESIPGFASSNNGEADQMEYAFGVQKVGSFNGRYKVYKNPYMTENVILLGYRGTQFLEAGAVFAPYIPLIMTPLVYDPNTFTPRKGLLTRYAKKMLRPEFYAKIYINGLNTL